MTGPGGWPGTGTAEIWARLRRPFDAIHTVDALLGLSPVAAQQFVGYLVATCPEAEALLNQMPHLIRRLAVSTTMKPVRCIGEIRGPVLWSETNAARGSSPGAGGVFICAAPVKAFDTDENRVLAAALDELWRAGESAALGVRSYDDDGLRAARRNGDRAMRYLEHRTLIDVTRVRPDGRSLRRARAGTKRRTYEPALAFLERVQEPVEVRHVLPYCDQRTLAQHDVFAAVLSGIESAGIRIPPLGTEHGSLVAGPVAYQHPRARAGADAGITVGRLLIDVPDRVNESDIFRASSALQSRAGDRASLLVPNARHIPEAVAAAIEHAVSAGARV